MWDKFEISHKLRHYPKQNYLIFLQCLVCQMCIYDESMAFKYLT